LAFKDIIGQAHAIDILHESIRQERLPHALLFTGPEGAGQLALAHALAQYVNCLNPVNGDSCGRCANCIKISKGIHPDMRFILPIFSKTEGGRRHLSDDYFPHFRDHFFEDPYFSFNEWQRTLGGENKQLFISVHEIRALKKAIYLKSFEAKYKIVIVWRAELINTEGANAFLKLLEEPPERTLILMTCSDPSKLLTTINSRCQRLRLERIPTTELEQYLVQKRGLNEEQAHEWAAISEGSASNAIEYLSESSESLSDTYISWLRAVYQGDYQKIQDQVQNIQKESKEFQKLFLATSVKKMRDSLMYQLGASQLALSTKKEQEFQTNFSKVIDPDKVSRIADLLEEARRNLTGNANPHMVLTGLSLRMHSVLRG